MGFPTGVASESLEYSIRPLEIQDLEAIVAAERLCHSHPWSLELFQRELDNPCASVDLLFFEGQLAGYLCSWLICGEIEIHNLATLPQFRRRGLAGKLLHHLLGRCPAGTLEKVLLEVRVSNVGAIALYRDFGFTDSAVRKSYYADGEDALLMELHITPTPSVSVISNQGEIHDA